MALFGDQVHFFLQLQHGKFPVAGLGSFLAGGGFQSRGQMNDPDGGIDLVYMLTYVMRAGQSVNLMPIPCCSAIQ